MRILIGDISSYKAIVIARFISKNYPHADVYGYSKKRIVKTIHTKYIAGNYIIKKEDSILNSLAKLVKEFSIDLLIPVNSEDLNNFWKNKTDFGNTLDYLGDYSAFEQLNNKNTLSEIANYLGIPIPAKYKSINEAEEPFVIKPSNLSSSQGVIYILDKSKYATEHVPTNNIIQQYVPGRGVGYSFYCVNGEIKKGYGHMRLAEYPVSGGSSTYRTAFEDQRMHDIAKKVVSHLKYTGFAMFEFKLTKDNKLFLLEVNPRIWGSINQGIANGNNYFESILGPASSSLKTKKTINTYLSPLVYISFLGYAWKLNFEPIRLFFKNLSQNHSDIHPLNDFYGYLSTFLRKLF